MLRISSPIELNSLDQFEYQASLLADVAEAQPGEQVAIVSMGFDPAEQAIQKLIEQGIMPAIDRGVEVVLGIDAYAFMFDDKFRPTGPLVWGRGLRSSSNPYFQRKIEALDELESEGARWGVVHAPRKGLHIPYAGRSHIKGAVVGDVFYLGGCGLDFTETPDAMVRGVDKATANYLASSFVQLASGLNMKEIAGGEDKTYDVDLDTAIHSDRGQRGESRIMNRALNFIDQAEDWLMLSCQYFPSGATAKALGRAMTERDVDVYVFFNNQRNRRLGGGIMRLLQLKDRHTSPSQLFDYELPVDASFIHSKILASEKGGMNGSHNYITQGVTLGTAEMTIDQNTPDFGIKLGKQLLRVVDWDINFAGRPLPDSLIDYDDAPALTLEIAA